MDIRNIDKNFIIEKITENNITFYDANDDRFSLHGGYYSYEDKKYRRLDKELARKVNDGVFVLAEHTSGIRVRFSTNSPFIAIRASLSKVIPMQHMPLTGQASFGLVVDGLSKKTFSVTFDDVHKSSKDETFFENIIYLNNTDFNDIEIYFPLYNGVNSLLIGVKDNSEIKPYSKPYSIDKPLLFYGSSITQGGCASKPDNQYSAIIAKKLNADFINLGFSGSAKGEDAISDYISSLNPSVFIYDYDHNAPTVEHLKNTHEKLFLNFRKNHKNTPVIMISKPDFHNDNVSENVLRREIVYSTYKNAVENGDKNVYFIDGETLFTAVDYDYCTVDGCHPNDLGFYRMATSILPFIKKALKIK